MKFISHRGNITGRNLERENTEYFINEAINKGFDCEVDVWVIENEYYLGHDFPVNKISKQFLQKKEIWAHAKNFEALERMLKDQIHCFWHQADDRVLTSRNFVWTYPEKETFKDSVIVILTEDLNLLNKNIYGVCGDYVEIWQSKNSSLY